MDMNQVTYLEAIFAPTREVRHGEDIIVLNVPPLEVATGLQSAYVAEIARLERDGLEDAETATRLAYTRLVQRAVAECLRVNDELAGRVISGTGGIWASPVAKAALELCGLAVDVDMDADEDQPGEEAEAEGNRPLGREPAARS